jgi:hypothetical protein
MLVHVFSYIFCFSILVIFSVSSQVLQYCCISLPWHLDSICLSWFKWYFPCFHQFFSHAWQLLYPITCTFVLVLAEWQHSHILSQCHFHSNDQKWFGYRHIALACTGFQIRAQLKVWAMQIYTGRWVFRLMVFDAALTRCYEAVLNVGDLNEYLVSFLTLY